MGSFKEFIKNQDSYAAPIALTLRQQKSIPTVYGGAITICHFCLLIGYMLYTCVDLIEPSWNISTWTVSGVDEDGITKEYYLKEYLIPTIYLDSANDSLPLD